jgi:hypothetical protein
MLCVISCLHINHFKPLDDDAGRKDASGKDRSLLGISVYS